MICISFFLFHQQKEVVVRRMTMKEKEPSCGAQRPINSILKSKVRMFVLAPPREGGG